MGRPQTNAQATLSRLPAATPRFVEPMKARLHRALPRGKGWLFEVKLDGIRAVAVKKGKQVHLYSRRPRNITAEYPALVRAIAELPVHSAVLDGEIVAQDSHGRNSFQAWQNAKRDPASQASLRYYAFDLLQVEGRDVTGLPLAQRRASLSLLLPKPTALLRLSPALAGSPARVWKQVLRDGHEGVVAKQLNSVYEPGQRSGAWLKVKRQAEQEFIIGGYTPPHGSRRYFGSLLLGVFERGTLIFVSRVGTGFDTRSLKSLYQSFQPFRTDSCPFSNLPTQRAGQFGPALTRSALRHSVWLAPRLVCQVRFLEWTSDHSLRQPVFLGLRDDKKPKDVVREKAGSARDRDTFPKAKR